MIPSEISVCDTWFTNRVRLLGVLSNRVICILKGSSCQRSMVAGSGFESAQITQLDCHQCLVTAFGILRRLNFICAPEKMIISICLCAVMHTITYKEIISTAYQCQCLAILLHKSVLTWSSAYMQGHSQSLRGGWPIVNLLVNSWVGARSALTGTTHHCQLSLRTLTHLVAAS